MCRPPGEEPASYYHVSSIPTRERMDAAGRASGEVLTMADAHKPRLCDDALIARMALHSRDGLRYDAALDVEGISRRTGANWRTWAAAGEEPYCTLLQTVTQARAQYEASLLDSIRTQSTSHGDGPAQEDWKARAWLLERTLPEHYAPTLAIVVKARGEATSDVMAAARRVLEPAQYALLLAALSGDDDVMDDNDAAHD